MEVIGSYFSGVQKGQDWESQPGCKSDGQGFVDVSSENIQAMESPEMRMMPPGSTGKATFTEDGNTKTAVDSDGDGQVEEVRTKFKDGGHAVMRDINNEGKAGFIKIWDKDGNVTMKSRDRDFDGKLDRLYTAEDTNGDSKLDTATLSFDDNYDGVMDRVGDGPQFVDPRR